MRTYRHHMPSTLIPPPGRPWVRVVDRLRADLLDHSATLTFATRRQGGLYVFVAGGHPDVVDPIVYAAISDACDL